MFSTLSITPAPVAAQAFTACVKESALAGLAAAPVNLLGIPEMSVEAPVMFTLKVAQACALNQSVAKRNTLLQALLPTEVAQFERLRRLFTEAEQVIGFGDRAGSEWNLGVNAPFLKLLPAMMASNWTRATAAKATAASRGEVVMATMTGSRGMRDLFRDPSGSVDALQGQAYADGAEVAFEAALLAEDQAQSLTTLADSLEKLMLADPIRSGRARQLRALAIVRTAIASNQKLRTESAMLRATADMATAGLGENYLERLAWSSSARVTP